jgi:hypothetical protein
MLLAVAHHDAQFSGVTLSFMLLSVHRATIENGNTEQPMQSFRHGSRISEVGADGNREVTRYAKLE